MSDLQPPPRGFRLERCARCALPTLLCVCKDDAPLSTSTRLELVLPRTETRSTTNTARLLKLWLPDNTSITVVGEHRQAPAPAPAPTPLPKDSALLFPTSDSVPLDTLPALANLPTTLVIPDGTWSQARRLARREMTQHSLPTVALAANWPSSYTLRRRSRGLCTFEAVAIALAYSDNSSLAQQLLARFHRWQHRAALLRTGLPPERCTSDPPDSHPSTPLLPRK